MLGTHTYAYVTSDCLLTVITGLALAASCMRACFSVTVSVLGESPTSARDRLGVAERGRVSKFSSVCFLAVSDRPLFTY